MPIVQYAEVRIDKPGAGAAVAGYAAKTTDGEYVVKASEYAISQATPGKTYARFGVGVKITSGPAQGLADVAFQLSFVQLGRLLPPWSGHLCVPSTPPMITPIGPWIAALGVSAIEATIVIGNRLGNYQLDVVYRTADASPESPNAWSNGILGAPLTSGESNTGEIAVTLTDKMWVQAGVASSLTSGTTLGQADVTVLFGIRQAT